MFTKLLRSFVERFFRHLKEQEASTQHPKNAIHTPSRLFEAFYAVVHKLEVTRMESLSRQDRYYRSNLYID
jgi:hypothetical protein